VIINERTGGINTKYYIIEQKDSVNVELEKRRVDSSK
jgi:hypothetical protein